MTENKLSEALKLLDMTYDELVVIAKEQVNSLSEPLNSLMSGMQDVNSLSNDELRSLVWGLSTLSLSYCEIKEYSSFKSELAEAIRKEKYAVSFNSTEGTVGKKESTAMLETSEEIVVETLYNLVSSLFKTKQDSIYRLVDTIKTILVTRNQEAKLNGTAREDF